ncbi:MAG: hypothetical protein QM483_03515 [Desulfuromusa sp.]
MSNPSRKTELRNGVIVEFFEQGNRYFGDFHRVQINVVATIPLIVDSLSVDLRELAANYPGFITYEKTLERMGVVTSQIETTTQSLIDDFLETAGRYLENKNFAERLLQKNMVTPSLRNHFSL